MEFQTGELLQYTNDGHLGPEHAWIQPDYATAVFEDKNTDFSMLPSFQVKQRACHRSAPNMYASEHTYIHPLDCSEESMHTIPHETGRLCLDDQWQADNCHHDTVTLLLEMEEDPNTANKVTSATMRPSYDNITGR